MATLQTEDKKVTGINFNKPRLEMTNENLDSATKIVREKLENGEKFNMNQLIEVLEEHDYSEAVARYLFWRLSESGAAKINSTWELEKKIENRV
jgi:hypothetical protein